MHGFLPKQKDPPCQALHCSNFHSYLQYGYFTVSPTFFFHSDISASTSKYSPSVSGLHPQEKSLSRAAFKASTFCTSSLDNLLILTLSWEILQKHQLCMYLFKQLALPCCHHTFSLNRNPAVLLDHYTKSYQQILCWAILGYCPRSTCLTLTNSIHFCCLHLLSHSFS